MLKLLEGSFLDGCGVWVHDAQTDNYYHLLVRTDKTNGKLFVEIGEKKYYEEDVKV